MIFFLNCIYKYRNDFDKNNNIYSFPMKIFLRKNSTKIKGCSFQIDEDPFLYKDYSEKESFLSNKIILNNSNRNTECVLHASNEIVGFQCGPPYKSYDNIQYRHLTNKSNDIQKNIFGIYSNNNSSYSHLFKNIFNNEHKLYNVGGYFQTEPINCFEFVNDNINVEDILPGAVPFPRFDLIHHDLDVNQTRYILLNETNQDKTISCTCNYFREPNIVYTGKIIIKVEEEKIYKTKKLQTEFNDIINNKKEIYHEKKNESYN